MTPTELADSIESEIEGIGPGFLRAIYYKPGDWRTIIAALRRSPAEGYKAPSPPQDTCSCGYPCTPCKRDRQECSAHYIA